MDLCSVTIVHRFTSPEWLKSLKGHLAGVSDILYEFEGAEQAKESGIRDRLKKSGVFKDILMLRVGEALLFSPSAAVGLYRQSDDKEVVKRLGADYLKIMVRTRLTTDGGRSVMAV